MEKYLKGLIIIVSLELFKFSEKDMKKQFQLSKSA